MSAWGTPLALGADQPTTNPIGTPLRLPSVNPPLADQQVQGWLSSGTSKATLQLARQALAQADQEFRVGAWLSAETSAWQAIRWAAESVDQDNNDARSRNRNTADLAISELQQARQAIKEARDFVNTFESQSPRAIARMARSHQTDVLKTDVLGNEGKPGLSATEASDRYLDFARVRLAAIASQRTEAAEAMDLLAAIYLRRGEAKTLPSATALCLRRAAIQGQPGNSSLATNLGIHLIEVGLHPEAQWALEHSMSIDPNPRTAQVLAALLKQDGKGEEASALIASVASSNQLNKGDRPIRVPEITRLTPDEFAALSKSVVWTDEPSDQTSAAPVGQEVDVTLASARVQSSARVPTITQVQPSTRDLANTRVPATEPNVSSDVETTRTPTFVTPVKTSAFDRLKSSWQRLTN
jgi:hypothetical protein